MKRLAEAIGASMSQAVKIAVKAALALEVAERLSADSAESADEQFA